MQFISGHISVFYRACAARQLSLARAAMCCLLLLPTIAWADYDWAPILPKAEKSLLLDITAAGDRLVAVGDRGHILYSDDNGASWQQVRVPTRQMLTSVWFNDNKTGWAVGHDGNIVYSTDGGASWVLQRNGLAEQSKLNNEDLNYLKQQLANLRARQAAEPTIDLAMEIEDAEFAIEDAVMLIEQGLYAAPLMDCLFLDEQHGFAVGAFGILLSTTNGGASWSSDKRRLDNPDGFHLNAITGDGKGRLLIAGEGGALYRSLDSGGSWQQLQSPYFGSWFGALYLASADRLLVFGLQGTAWYSDDFGDSWQQSDTGSRNSLAGGYADDQDVILVGGVGVVIRSTDNGASFNSLPNLQGSLSAINPTANSYIAVGTTGNQVFDITDKKEQ